MLDLDFEAQRLGSSFTLWHGHLKKTILLHKRARVPFDSLHSGYFPIGPGSESLFMSYS